MNNETGWDQSQVNEAMRQSLQDQPRSQQWSWGQVNHQQQQSQPPPPPPPPLTPLLNQGPQLPFPPGVSPGFHTPLSLLNQQAGDPMNVEPQISPGKLLP